MIYINVVSDQCVPYIPLTILCFLSINTKIESENHLAQITKYHWCEE